MRAPQRPVARAGAVLLILALLATAARAEPRGGGRRGPPRDRGPKKYSIEQATSERAQLHTLAFSGLAFLTGDFGASTFLPPGKVCDFFGFQYMRDIDAEEKGHNPLFLNRVAGNVMRTLDEAQHQQFLDLAAEQGPQLEQLARMRLPVIRAFHLEADGKRPKRSKGLNREAVVEAVGQIFRFDAELSLRRAEVMAGVWRSLSAEQKRTLGAMKFGDFDTWSDVDPHDEMRRRTRRQTHLVRVAYMTYASEFFSWTAGSLEADTYFCPERHATYFGGFYMKDMPAMGRRDYDISTTITGESGRTFVDEILEAKQRALLTGVIERQRPGLLAIVEIRRGIAVELRKLLDGKKADRARVLKLGERYGRLDGELSWDAAVALAKINATLTDEQRADLKRLRNLAGYDSAAYYLYSRPGRTRLDVEQAAAALFFAP